MPTYFDQLLRRFGVGVDELAGTSIAGEVPLTNDLLNRFLSQRLAASHGPVTGVHVEALDDDHMSVRLSLRGPLPAVGIAVRIEQQPVLPNSPVLGLRWSVPGMGALGLLAAPALTWLKALPPGIRADGDRIEVDLAQVVRSQGVAELLPYLSKLRVHTRKGAALVQFELRIGAAH